MLDRQADTVVSSPERSEYRARVATMPPTTRRLVVMAVLISVLSLLGFIIAYIFQWPSEFAIGGAADSVVTIPDDIIAGTPLSIPLPTWAPFIVVTFLAASRRWWGTIAVVVLGLLGLLFVFAGWNEAFGPPNPHVPQSVLLMSGIIWGLLGLSLFLLSSLDLFDRIRAWRAK